MNNLTTLHALERLEQSRPSWPTPYVSELAQKTGDPFLVLVSCILSLRTRDLTTAQGSKRLFRQASSAKALSLLAPSKIETLIHPVSFSRQKSVQLHALALKLLSEHQGRVPDQRKELMALPGVGPKTAALVLGMAFGQDAICVDIHVHRIPNRWGAIQTKSPEESEKALMDLLPKRWWQPLNDLLVAFGQNICKPTSPHCSICPISGDCARIGVSKTR